MKIRTLKPACAVPGSESRLVCRLRFRGDLEVHAQPNSLPESRDRPSRRTKITCNKYMGNFEQTPKRA
jgi:hypothetical protein